MAPIDPLSSSPTPQTYASDHFSKVVDKAAAESSFITLDENSRPPEDLLPPTREDIPGVDAFYVDNVLSESECSQLIQMTEKAGYSFWDPSNKRRTADPFRTAFTVEIEHDGLSKLLWKRVNHLLSPIDIAEHPEGTDHPDCIFEVDLGGSWDPVGFQRKALFARYLDGGHFAPHTDGCTPIDFNTRSLYSVVLFLNRSDWGGQTRIYSNNQKHEELQLDKDGGRLTGRSNNIVYEVEPRPGRMLVFYHTIMHEGVAASNKYIIRSDVIYRRREPFCTLPEDIEAFDMYLKAQLLAETGSLNEAQQLFRRAFKKSPALSRVYGQG